MPAQATKTVDGKSPPHQTQTQTKKKPAKYYDSETESDYSTEDVESPQREQRKQSGGAGNQLSKTTGDVSKTAEGLGTSASNTLGNVTGSALQSDGKKQDKSDTLRLRLDLNLDVEIQLKAKIYGNVELALL
jgi:hypothetical protein